MAGAKTGDEVPAVDNGQHVYFKTIGVDGADKLQVGDAWPFDNLPSPTSSLLAIASRKGVFVAATPSGLDITTTENARRSYIRRRPEGEKPLQPLKIDVHLDLPRISHIAFTADEAWLVVAFDQSGRLAVYATDRLANGAQPAHEIETSGNGVRHLFPNPQDEPMPSHRNVCAVVLSNGNLLFVKVSESDHLYSDHRGKNVFCNNVASGTWSKMGKQFVAGLVDGTAVRIDPLNSSKDNVVEKVPRAPQLEAPVTEPDYSNAKSIALTSISWLKTKGGMSYLFVYSPVYAPYSDPDDAAVDPQESLYFIVERSPNQGHIFRPFARAPTDDFGVKRRTPASQAILRISDWHKAEEILIVGSSVGPELGVITEFKEQVPDDAPAGFASYFPIHKVGMPYNDEQLTDGSAVGIALDFSTTEVASNPIDDDADVCPHSKLPLPALYALDFSGILSIHWVVYVDGIRQNVFAPGIVHRSGRYAMYEKINPRVAIDDEEYRGKSSAEGEEAVETEPLDATSPVDAPRSGPSFAPLPPSTAPKTTFGQPSAAANTPAASQTKSAFGQATQQSSSGFGQASAPAFGQSSTPGFGQPSKPAFGQASASDFGQPSKPTFGQTSASGFGQPSTPAFGQPSAPAFGGTSAIGQSKSPWGSAGMPAAIPASQSPFGAKSAGQSPFGTSAFGKPSGFGQPPTPGQSGSTSAFGSVGQMAANKPSPFGGNASGGMSGFASVGQSAAASPFAKPALSQGGSNLSGFGNLSSAGSGNTVSGFGSGSSFAASSFNSKGAISRESTTNEDSEQQRSSGLSGMEGFKLGSGFKGDGSAKDDLPMPKNPGAGFFGSELGSSLGAAANGRPLPFIKQEPGTEKQTSMKDIPAASSAVAPLPPDPTTYKAPEGWNDDIPGAGPPVNMKQTANDAPLPPDPTTYKPPADWNAVIPGAGPAVNAKPPEKDAPIAGSPPIDVMNSQSFGDALSEIAGPSEDGSEDWADDDDEEDQGEDEDEEGDDEEDQEDDDGDDEESEEEEEADEEVPFQPKDPAGLAAFKARMQPAEPKSPEPQRSRNESRTPQSDEKSMKSSYTPAGLPKGPVFPPPPTGPQHSPRSPSPQRAVTSPVRTRDLLLPPQIKATAVPPAKPLERSTPAPKPKEPTTGELADQAAQRVEEELARPIEPTTELPPFYAHTDYTGNVDTPGLGGQIEKVYRDINSMVHTVGLNARSINSFLDGQEKMRQPGQRTRDDLDNPDVWLLGDVVDLGCIIDDISKQLEDGKLDAAPETLAEISQEHNEVLKLKVQGSEIRKQVQAHKDPERLAAQDAAPLDGETKAQQSELRSGVQRVQKLLNDIEQKMTMLRADLASLSHRDGRTNGQSPVPTVEAVMNTIQRMTAAVQQRSADIDFLEAQIKRLPSGIESLRLGDDYEDDLASRLGNSRLLTDRGSPAATPPRRPRMAANGDPLGMSGMFGSRFATPPSASMRQSTRFTPDLGRSTNSLNGSARKKMADVTPQEVEEFQAKAARRRNVLGALKKRVETNGAKVIRAA